MVKVRADVPQTADGRIDVGAWAAGLCDAHDHVDATALMECCSWVGERDEAALLIGMELAELVADLQMDQPAVHAAVLYRGVREERFSRDDVQSLFGGEVAHLVFAVAAMATTSLLEMSNSPLQEKEQQDQVENIKRMLAALIDDVRVAVLKLAERVVALRQAKRYDEARRIRIAREARGVFAPLANRLGIWQLKWELEDLAFRYLKQDVYMDIAGQLEGKRRERETQVLHMADQVRALLRGQGIDAAVFGRAKNIYSIWRKMQSKGVSVDQVYDVRAVRVVVDSLAQCYAALGLIHTTWKHIPTEFDDYIATPKENGYQSIHTAVTVDDGKTLEVQIRTRDMHDDAELGVCAHWSYKDGTEEAQDFAAKMDWLRQVMEWHDELGGTTRLSELLQEGVSQDRIFVSTPGGHVLDLSHGATALDFAYRVHTDIGNSCQGAQVNGITVPLYTVLKTGEQVAVTTAENALPRREWLEPELNLVCTNRARAKILSYFKSLQHRERVHVAREVIEGILEGLGLEEVLTAALENLAGDTDSVDELLASIGGGDAPFIGPLATLLEQDGVTEQLSLPGIVPVSFPDSVRLKIVGDNREGLLHDVTQLIADMHVPLTGTTGRVSNPPTQAIITVDVTLETALAGLRLVSYIRMVPGVIEIRRMGTNEGRAGSPGGALQSTRIATKE